MAQHHHYDISTIEDLLPFERDIYIGMLIDYLKYLEDQKRLQNQK